MNDTESQPLQLLVYVSQMTQPMAADELKELVAQALKKNESQGITGTLLVLNDHFVQFLEGAPEEIERLMVTIKADSRHERVEVILTEVVNRRHFADWGMSVVLFGSRLFVTDKDLVNLQKAINSMISERGIDTNSLKEILTTVPKLLLDKKLTAIDLTKATSLAEC